MRKITEYTKVQLDRNSLNSFDTIIAKFDPKKIEAAITLVLGRQGLYETYYYEALMEQILKKLKDKEIVIGALLSDLPYSDLPSFEAMKEEVNDRYGEALVDEIVDKISEEAQNDDSSDDFESSVNEEAEDKDAWEKKAKEEAEKRASNTSEKSSELALVDVITPPCDAGDTEKSAAEWQKEFLEGADVTPTYINQATGEMTEEKPPRGGDYVLVDGKGTWIVEVDDNGHITSKETLTPGTIVNGFDKDNNQTQIVLTEEGDIEIYGDPSALSPGCDDTCDGSCDHPVCDCDCDVCDCVVGPCDVNPCDCDNECHGGDVCDMCSGDGACNDCCVGDGGCAHGDATCDCCVNDCCVNDCVDCDSCDSIGCPTDFCFGGDI